MQLFDSGIVKINKDGNRVFSTYLDDGETLADPTQKDGIKVEKSSDTLKQDHDQSGESPQSQDGENEPDIRFVENEDGSGGAAAGPGLERSERHDPENQVPTESDHGTAGKVVPTGATPPAGSEDDNSGDDGSESNDENKSDDEGSGENKSETERPKDTDNKDAWFAYAQSKGYTGDRDDNTVKQYIEQYG